MYDYHVGPNPDPTIKERLDTDPDRNKANIPASSYIIHRNICIAQVNIVDVHNALFDNKKKELFNND